MLSQTAPSTNISPASLAFVQIGVIHKRGRQNGASRGANRHHGTTTALQCLSMLCFAMHTYVFVNFPCSHRVPRCLLFVFVVVAIYFFDMFWYHFGSISVSFWDPFEGSSLRVSLTPSGARPETFKKKLRKLTFPAETVVYS